MWIEASAARLNRTSPVGHMQLCAPRLAQAAEGRNGVSRRHPPEDHRAADARERPGARSLQELPFRG